MSFFRLFALGDDFDVDAYVKTSPLEFDRVWHRSDPKPGGIGRYANSGLQIELGDGRDLAIDEQDRIAAEFIEAHEQPLRELSDFEGVTHVTLVLHFFIEAAPDLVSTTVSPSFRLMHFALRAAVSPRYYVELVRKPFE